LLTATVEDVFQATAKKLGWQEADKLLRLEGGRQLAALGLAVLREQERGPIAEIGRLVKHAVQTGPPPHLAGFTDPWERLLFKGRDLAAGAKLADHGVGAGVTVTVVRRALFADGWEVRDMRACC
jgi:hypothetical protein